MIKRFADRMQNLNRFHKKILVSFEIAVLL